MAGSFNTIRKHTRIW